MQVVSLCSPQYHRADSYGRIADELRVGLMQAGYHVNTLSLSNDSPHTTHIPALGGIMLGYPTNFKKFSSLASQIGPRIAVTMFESTQLPKGWTQVLNELSAVIVPSQWCKQTFIDNGVTAPIHVVSLGVSDAFQYHQRQLRRNKPYTFITIADRKMRKGYYSVLEAFNRAFGDDPNYLLLLKAREGTLGYRLSNPNIKIVSRDMTEKQLARLYCSAHCMVLASYGEGFGLPNREFAATGGTVLATNWGGTADHIGLWGVPIDCQMQPAWEYEKDPTLRGLGQWAKPDVEYLMRLMVREAQPDMRRARQIMAKRVAQDTHELYSWQRFSQQVVAIWQQSCKLYAEQQKGHDNGRRQNAELETKRYEAGAAAGR